MPGTKYTVFAAVILALALALGAISWLWPKETHSPISSGEALVGGPFALVDQDGQSFSEQQLLGKPSLLFFGYTFCPDVCPTELQVMSAAVRDLGAAAPRVIFVTIDPERDTPEVLKSYLSSFDPPVTGLTGSAEQIAAMAKAYRIFYQKVPMGSAGDYRMDHTSLVYLMGADGKFVTYFDYTTDAKTLTAALSKALGP